MKSIYSYASYEIVLYIKYLFTVAFHSEVLVIWLSPWSK